MGIEPHKVIELASSKAQLNLVLPLLLALWMAWGDMKTNRIPNYLTLGTTLAGLGYQLGFRGWTGLVDGFLGIGLGFGLLIFFYFKGGLGAGDVKALAALGAWLGPSQTIYLFIYMALSGVLVAVGFLWRRGLLRNKIEQIWGALVNMVLLHTQPSISESKAAPNSEAISIPYGLALALGMAILCGRGFIDLNH